MIGKNGIEAVYEDLDAEFPNCIKKEIKKTADRKFAPIKVKAGNKIRFFRFMRDVVPGGTGGCSRTYVLWKDLPASSDDRSAVF